MDRLIRDFIHVHVGDRHAEKRRLLMTSLSFLIEQYPAGFDTLYRALNQRRTTETKDAVESISLAGKNTRGPQ